jgi:hypothetical protein
MRLLATLLAMLALCPRAQADYEWRPNGETEWALYSNGRHVGSWSDKHGVYRPFDGANFGDPDEPPIRAPVRSDNNFGVDQSKLADQERYEVNGHPASRTEAWKLIEGKQLPDDAMKLRLTVIGPKPARETVLSDVRSSPVLTPLRDAFLLSDYEPDHWAVKDLFFTGGTPTIYVQASDGKVLHRQDDYRGPEKLAEAIRKARDYDAKKDPDQNKVLPGLPFQLPDWPAWVWVLLGGGGLYALSGLYPKLKAAAAARAAPTPGSFGKSDEVSAFLKALLDEAKKRPPA